MGLSSAVEWWQEWQLRILVLSSLAVQLLLLFTASWRKLAIPSWFRSIIWLSYLGSDALAIYALATLFNRQTKQDYRSAQGNSVLEVVWAPVLLMHLGGQDPITAYNIEDNELWARHIVTSLSQIAVAIYVFCKSWRGGDTRLLQAAILLFIPGVLKCLEKPLALKGASINSLDSSSKSADPTTEDTGNMQQHEKNIDTLEEYVRAARTSFQANENSEAQEVPPHIVRPSHLFVDLTSSYSERLSVLNSIRTLDEGKVYDLLQDGLSNIFDLLYTKDTLVSFFLSDPDPDMQQHQQQISWLHRLRLIVQLISRFGWQKVFGILIRALCLYLPWATIGLFHKSHREAYNDNDVKVTYALLCCTAVLEVYSVIGMKMYVDSFKSLKYSERIFLRRKTKYSERTDSTETVPSTLSKETRSGTVSQYSLIGFFVRNKRHTKKMWVVSLFQCKEFLDQRLCMKPRDSSFIITKLVLEYVKKGWEDQIKDVDSYWKFNDHRGMRTLAENKCDQELLVWSLRRPFDESVLLWHIATDFCFHSMDPASTDQQGGIVGCDQDDASGQSHGCTRCRHERAVRCREMSNYMTYLLFVKPEMLLPGTRRKLFITANAELEKILDGGRPSLKTILWTEFKKIFNCKTPSLKEILKGKKPSLREILTETLEGKRPSRKEIERGLAQMIIAKVKSTGCTKSPPDLENPTTQKGFIHNAWKISQELLALGDEDKMWKVIEGVWVEMFCFSASRSRGYLHAKSLGTGQELITYLWLLLSHMGMETLTERLQRQEHSSGGDNAGTAPSTSQGSTATGEGTIG